MALTIYTLWVERLIAGTHTIRQVPVSFRDEIRRILKSRRYTIGKDGTAKKIQNGIKK